MKPVFFEIGPFVIYSYGVMLALGSLIATALAMRCARHQGIAPEKILDLALLILITGIIGSRALYVALNWSDFSKAPLNIFLLNKGGLVIYGGFALSIPVGVWFIKKSGLATWKTMDLVSPYVVLGQSIGRIGCLLNGCCYGKPTSFILGIYFPNHTSRIHPTQLYSSISLLLIFIILKYFYQRRHFDGAVFFYYLMLYSFFRFFIEFLRGDNPTFMFGLTLSQYISALLFAGSIIFYIRRRSLWKNILSP